MELLAFQELAATEASVLAPQLLGSIMVWLLVLESPLIMKIRHHFQEFIHLWLLLSFSCGQTSELVALCYVFLLFRLLVLLLDSEAISLNFCSVEVTSLFFLVISIS